MSGDSGVTGVYGKVASQADFLRAGAGEFSQAGLDRWFQDGVEVMRTERTALPAAPTSFVLAPPGSASAFVGAFAPSADAAGRSFPLVVFTEVVAAGLGEALPSLPAAFSGYVERAGALALAGGTLAGPDLVAQAQTLAPPSAPAGGDPLAGESAQPLLGAVGVSPAALAYALRTFSSACDQAAKTGPESRTGVITVDAPAPTTAVRALWLELARRRLRWRGAFPSLLWSNGRLLIVLGAPPPSTLAYLANPRHRAPRFWPLRTEVATAADAALKALTPEQRRLVENPRASLGELAWAFG